MLKKEVQSPQLFPYKNKLLTEMICIFIPRIQHKSERQSIQQMKPQQLKTERIHALDSLRAIMMLLGLVIHSAFSYKVTGHGWPLKDPTATHLSNDFIVSFIHSFRMQIFFVVAGFFGSMLFYERNLLQMVKNRASRIVLPFVVFVILLWPTIVLCFGYTKALFAGSLHPLSDVLANNTLADLFIPKHPFHLWFLYYLAMITFVSVILGLLFKKLPNLTTRVSTAFNWTITQPFLRILIFVSLTILLYVVMGTTVLRTKSFVPYSNTFVYYFFFYIVGWILFKSKQHLSSFMKYDWASTILGITLFSYLFYKRGSMHYETIILLKALIVWLFIFGITGLFIRFGSRHSARMRYISDASYWVYLIHLPIAAIIPGLIADWSLPSTLKFLIVVVTTGVICFVTYHYLVRSTFIGQFLNGRTYSRKLAEIKITNTPSSSRRINKEELSS